MKESDFFLAKNDPEFNRIISIFEKMLSTGKSTYLEDYELADLATFYYDNNEEEKLKKVFELADSLHPDSNELMHIKARFFLKQGDMNKANGILEQMKKEEASFSQEEDDEDSYYKTEMRVNIKMLEGEKALMEHCPEEAEEYFLQAFDLAAENEDKAYVSINVAFIYLAKKMEEKIIEWVERSIKLLPGNQPAMELLTNYYGNQGDIKKAEKMLNKLVDENPYSIRYWKLAGDIYLNNYYYEKAIDAYDFVLAIDANDKESLKKKAVAFMNLDNDEMAYQLLSEYQKRVPDDYGAMMLSALCLASMERITEATELLERIMKETNNAEDDPTINQTELFHLIIRTYRMIMNFDKALEWIDKALEYGLNDVFYNVMKGGVYMELDKEEMAQRYFSIAVGKTENKQYALSLIANEYFIFQDYTASNKLLLQIYESYDKDKFPTITGMLAYGYFCLNKYDEYLKFLKEACEDEPEETFILFSDRIPKDMSLEEFYSSEEKKYS